MQKIKFKIVENKDKYVILNISLNDGEPLLDLIKSNKYDYISIRLDNAKDGARVCISQNVARPENWAIRTINMNDFHDLIKGHYKEHKFLSLLKIKNSVEKIISTYQMRAIFG